MPHCKCEHDHIFHAPDCPERSLLDARAPAVSGEDLCVIYCTRDDCYWKSDAQGYGPLWEAGIYTRNEAEQLASNPDRHDKVIPLSTLQERIRDEVAGLQGLVVL